MGATEITEGTQLLGISEGRATQRLALSNQLAEAPVLFSACSVLSVLSVANYLSRRGGCIASIRKSSRFPLPYSSRPEGVDHVFDRQRRRNARRGRIRVGNVRRVSLRDHDARGIPVGRDRAPARSGGFSYSAAALPPTRGSAAAVNSPLPPRAIACAVPMPSSTSTSWPRSRSPRTIASS